MVCQYSRRRAVSREKRMTPAAGGEEGDASAVTTVTLVMTG
jgi:hypothetical protein